MSERDQSPYPTGSGSAQENTTDRPTDETWREQTTPGITPVPASAAPAATGPDERYYTTPQYSTQPVAIRRPDTVAALLLILAGIAAGVSLLLSWLPQQNATGWEVLRRGFQIIAEEGFARLFTSGFWQPLAVVLGGGVLFVLGLLLLVPARAHRFLGLLALLVTLAVGAGVLVPLADEGWRLGDFRVGFWFAVAVAALGLLGSLKALLTGPRYGTTRPPGA